MAWQPEEIWIMSNARSAKAGHDCSVCGAVYSDEEWRSLRLTERIGASEVRRLVLGWSEAACIEVRGCRRCGRSIAVKRVATSDGARQG
jgi:hypothetical protein